MVVLPHLRLPARIVGGADDPFQNLRYGERFATDLAAPRCARSATVGISLPKTIPTSSRRRSSRCCATLDAQDGQVATVPGCNRKPAASEWTL